MTRHEFERVVQDTLTERLDPVRFGRFERWTFWAVLVFAAVSLVASIATFALTLTIH